MFTFNDVDAENDALDPEDRRVLAALWQAAVVALDAASLSMQEAVARAVRAGGEMTGDLLDDGAVVVVRIGEIEVLRTSPRVIRGQMDAADHAAVN